MKKILSVLVVIIIPSICVEAKHLYKEADYQKVWCSLHNGITEYKNKDLTRVDCLTKSHAVEFDFANKWAESVGQAEYYAMMTGLRGKVVLIIENDNEYKYLKRVRKLAKIHDFDVDYVTPEIFNNYVK